MEKEDKPFLPPQKKDTNPTGKRRKAPPARRSKVQPLVRYASRAPSRALAQDAADVRKAVEKAIPLLEKGPPAQ